MIDLTPLLTLKRVLRGSVQNVVAYLSLFAQAKRMALWAFPWGLWWMQPAPWVVQGWQDEARAWAGPLAVGRGS